MFTTELSMTMGWLFGYSFLMLAIGVITAVAIRAMHDHDKRVRRENAPLELYRPGGRHD